MPQKEINTCPKCGASILVNSMFSVVTCSYCQSKFSLQQTTNTNASIPEAVPYKLPKPKTPHPLMGKFYSLMGLFVFCLVVFTVSTLQLDKVQSSNFAYTLCIIGCVGGLLASVGILLRAAVLAATVVYGKNEE